MNQKPTRGMGRGLSALLGEDADIKDLRQPVGYINKSVVDQQGGSPAQGRVHNVDIVRIPLDMIVANPFQPRITFDEDGLAELAESIRVLGLIQPITVRKVSEGHFQIISGERRFRASKLAGLDMIPAYIRDVSDQGMLEMAIVENVQRQDLDPIEVAMSYQRLIDECGMTQEQMADRVGKKRASVTNYLRLLKLPVKIQHDLKVGMLSVGHAKVLLGVDNPSVQEELCDDVIREDLSVRALEDRVALLGHARKKPEKQAVSAPSSTPVLPDNYARVREQLGKYFSDRVAVKPGKNGKGTITIKFSSEQELESFFNDLKK